jgi:hypothetical protein
MGEFIKIVESGCSEGVLLEMPQAVIGDFDWDEAKLRVTDIGIEKYWKTVGKLEAPTGALDIVQCRENWMVGRMHARDTVPDRQEFRALISVEGEVPSRKTPYRNPLIIRFVYVSTERRARGLATSLYQWFVEQDYTPIGDQEQYNGARRLWARLSTLPGYAVDILNVYTGRVVKTGVTLLQGAVELDFDKNVWSLDERLVHFRPVLRKASMPVAPTTKEAVR